MAEILGAAASAAQLAACCAHIMDLIGKARHGSESLRRYQQQLQELRGLSDSIFRNPLLQAEEIQLLTVSIINTIDKIDLKHWLHKGRLHQALALLRYDRQLLDLFTTLERQKSTLSLTIDDIQSKALHEIRLGIRVMSKRNPARRAGSSKSDSYCMDQAHQGIKEEDDTTVNDPSSSVGGPAGPFTAVYEPNQTDDDQHNSLPPYVDILAGLSLLDADGRQAFIDQALQLQPDVPLSLSYGNVAEDANQYNADRFTCDSEDPEEIQRAMQLMGALSTGTLTMNNIHIGAGDQLNGPAYELAAGDVANMTAAAPPLPSHSVENYMIKGSNPDPNRTARGNQVNRVSVTVSNKDKGNKEKGKGDKEKAKDGKEKGKAKGNKKKH